MIKYLNKTSITDAWDPLCEGAPFSIFYLMMFTVCTQLDTNTCGVLLTGGQKVREEISPDFCESGDENILMELHQGQ